MAAPLRFRHVVALALLAPGVCAAQGGFLDRHGEGWFWYRDPPVEEEPEEEPTPPLIPALIAPQPDVQVPLKAPEPTAFMSSAWIKENLPKFMERALDDPSPENVTAYLALQRISMDRSQRFSNSAVAAAYGNPLLDQSTRRPLSSAGALETTMAAGRATNDLLKELAQEVGVWYFYRADCPYCQKQGPLLSALTRNYGLFIQPIAMDGQPPPSGEFRSWRNDDGHAAILNVQATPAIFLIRPATEEIVPVSQGFLSLPELKDRIIQASHRAEWVDDERYQRTRPIAPDAPSIEDVERLLTPVIAAATPKTEKDGAIPLSAEGDPR